jgi:hypothetical protein
MKSARIPCCVPYCGRTFADDGSFTEVLCGRHYRLARPTLRRRLTRVRRRYRKALLRGEQTSAVRAQRLDDAIWRAIKREAIEVAVGITA